MHQLIVLAVVEGRTLLKLIPMPRRVLNDLTQVRPMLSLSESHSSRAIDPSAHVCLHTTHVLMYP